MRALLVVTLFIFSSTSAFADYALRGTLVTPDEVIENGILLVSSDGKIAGADADVAVPDGVPVIETNGFIYPGLIDLHNHLTWNMHPRWKPPQPTKNRYDWQAMLEYARDLNGPHYVLPKELGCDQQRFAEVKALAFGATSVVGGFPNDCNYGLARNLDYALPFPETEALLYKVFPLELPPDEELAVRNAMAAGRPVIVHLSEGIDASAAREARMVNAHRFFSPGFVVIHGVALKESDYRDLLGKNGVGLVWSPRSNIELYGKTADIAVAKKYVKIAIAPDWSPSGSQGMTAELQYAAKLPSEPFTPQELVQMATTNPADLARIANKAGRLETGMYADYVVVKRGTRDAYDSLIYASTSDITTVAVGGRPVFGDATLMTAIQPKAKLEAISVCGVMKSVDMSDSDNGKGTSFATTMTTLENAFKTAKIPLAGLDQCD
jgi:cytosine/adenosine deaminase-related metal-dependent hydrolase